MNTEMKDSGIAWIGEIPKHWGICKIQYMANLKSGYNLTTEEISDEGLYPVFGGNGIRGYYNQFFIEGEYVLIGRQGALCGNINYSSGKFWATEHAVICCPKVKFATRWFGELLRSMNLNQYSLASAQPGLAVERIKALSIPLPSLSEQTAIAQHLDKKCAEIDELISLQEQMIAQLTTYKQAVITETVTRGLNPHVKMKPSGVEWIGEIPEHWEICRLKNLIKGNLQYGANESGVSFEADLPRYVRITDILDNKLRDDITKLSLTNEQAEDYILQNNDLLFARSGATVGKAFIYDESYGKCAFAGYLIRASIHNNHNAKYVYYYTQTSMYEEWKKQVFVQATIQNIGADKYAQLSVIVPPIAEQTAIAQYLDKKCQDIDALISLKQEKIEQLKHYKKSVIYEYVTGKKRV